MNSTKITVKRNDKNEVIEATVSKIFCKRANIFGTQEYAEWEQFIAKNPKAKMVTKTRANKTKVLSTRNLSYKNMEIFISAQDNAEELLVEFRKIKKISCIQTSPYRSVLAWFLEKFESYDSYKDFLEKLAEEAKRKEAEKENDSAVA